MNRQRDGCIDSPRFRSHLVVSTVAVTVFLFQPGPARGRQPDSASISNPKLRVRQSLLETAPEVQTTAHRRSNLQLVLRNNGTFGSSEYSFRDATSWEVIRSCEYPRGSDINFIGTGGLWIGAIIGMDTLVTCAADDWGSNEFWPTEPGLGGRFSFASIDRNSPHYDPNVKAYSEDDIICEYYDTLTDTSVVNSDLVDERPHRPLNIKVTQRSMSWSHDYADDFIIFDYQVENIGLRRLNKVYVGIWIDGDVYHFLGGSAIDDITGFLRSSPAPEGCGFVDTVNVAWHADGDGDYLWRGHYVFDFRSPKGVVGVKILDAPSDSVKFSYNWWAFDYGQSYIEFGPRKIGTAEDPFRAFAYGYLGFPPGDRDKYYLMRHDEVDYDLLWSAVWQTGDGWMPPPPEQVAKDLARGADCRYLLSFGPFNFNPGQILPFTIALVGAPDFHRDPAGFRHLYWPTRPRRYCEYLNFAQLARNARWAAAVFDNPGVDTDGDGYAGEARVCEDGVFSDPDLATEEKVWYKGDGVPDFRGASPPPAPKLRLIPSLGSIAVRWNGFYSETTPDIFSGRPDFEGYRIYAGRDSLPGSYSFVHTYDREDYKRFVFTELAGGGYWEADNRPYTPEELAGMYGIPDFEPRDYTRTSPFEFNGRFYYFEAQDHNFSEFVPTGVHKVFPTATDPGTDPSLWAPEDVVDYYDEPLPKYYEYEYIHAGLLPTVPYYIAVTVFDYGSPQSGLDGMETYPDENFLGTFPQTSAEDVGQQELDVYVYPNPYLIDARYADNWYENPHRDLAPDRARRIHFANLPNVCKISIYSLDGDLIRELDHNYPEGGHLAMHHTWDLINRNVQTVVSGLYFWVVESETRTQIGKLVIIK